MTSKLTDLLRGLPDDALATLCRLRPDLVVPVPRDLGALAARAQSRSSVARVLDKLDRFQLEILDAVRLTRDPGGVTSLDEVLAVAAAPAGGADAAQVRAAVHQLRKHLLVYGPEPELQVVPAVDEVAGPYPAGLGRPAAALDSAAAALVGDPAGLRRTLLSAPPAARAVLDRLSAGPPVGTTAKDQPGPAEAGNGATAAVDWLLDHGLLVATSPTTVELPREVGVLLRRDTGPLGPLHPTPPRLASTAAESAAVDAAGAGQAMEAVRHTEALLEAFAVHRPPLLRAGGLGVRELRRLARAAGLDEKTAGLLTEVAAAAGLLGHNAEPGGTASDLRPTVSYDSWRTVPLAARWHTLASHWLTMTRRPGLVGERDGKDRLLAVLAAELERAAAPAIRHAVLDLLAQLPPGTPVTADELLELLNWHLPRRTPAWGAVARELLSEAAALGITGRYALTSYGRALVTELDREPEPDRDPLGVSGPDAPSGLIEAAARLDALLPAPVDQVVVQADLTVVVPGPPEPALAAELELVAEHESAGGGSVYRVTRDSIRRAYDAGYHQHDLHGLFRRRSRTAVPQTLTYLIDDVARSHGGLRVGSAGAYLRSDDEALLAQVLADRQLAPLRLRQLAPTVLVAGIGTAHLLTALREAGYPPVPEDASGAALLLRPRVRRAPAKPPVVPPVDPFAAARMTPAQLAGIIEDLRRRDAAARAIRRGPYPRRGNGTAPVAAAQAYPEAMAVLQRAVRDRVLVWVSYLDAHGMSKVRLLRPVSIGAGYLRAEDERTETVHTFALHRVTSVVPDL